MRGGSIASFEVRVHDDVYDITPKFLYIASI